MPVPSTKIFTDNYIHQNVPKKVDVIRLIGSYGHVNIFIYIKHMPLPEVNINQYIYEQDNLFHKDKEKINWIYHYIQKIIHKSFHEED